MAAANDVRSIFLAAAERPAAERPEYLHKACGDDADLRKRVDALLRAHDEPGEFLSEEILGGEAPERTTAYRPPPGQRPGDVIAGRYKLLEPIGEGGMGAVWVAEQTEPVRRKVAIKLIKAGMDSKSVLARFEAERQALAVMDHPNIAKVLDGGLTDAGRPFFVMEYVKGVPITEYCDAVRLSVPDRLNLFVQVCHAVQHAHQKGIIHRDLKPRNILVAPYDDRPIPKVIDFGLAKAMHQSLTERTLHTAHDTVLGTPLYMSPEQAQLNNLDVDTRSDVYSLGVLLYELLTGTTPLEKRRFKEAAWDEIKRIIREEEPPRPSARLSTTDLLPALASGRQIEPARLTKLVRGDLDWIVMKALEKDRARRYETANGFAADVQRHLNGEPVEACPPSATYRLRKFVRRNAIQVSAASLILLALLTGVAGTTWGLYRAERQRLRAEESEAAALKVRDDALAARQAADWERGTAEAIQRFVTFDLLGRTNAWLGGEYAVADRSPDVTVRAVLERAGERVGARFQDQPLVEAGIRRAIGGGLASMGRNREARLHFERSLELYRRHRGADHPDTLAALRGLGGHLSWQLAEFEAGERYLREAHEGYLKLYGPDHPTTIDATAGYADALNMSKKESESIRLKMDSYERSLRILGPDSQQSAVLRNGLVYIYTKQGDFATAEKLAVEGLERTGKTFGKNHALPHICAGFLAWVYTSSGRPKLAEPIAIEWMENARRVFGEKSHIAQDAVKPVIHSYIQQKRFADALPLCETNYAARRESYPLHHEKTQEASEWLILSYTRVGRFADAARVIDEAGPGVSPRRLYDSACTFALWAGQGATAQERETAALKAMELLRSATAKGWANPVHTVVDPDMAALLEREDYRRTLATVGKSDAKHHAEALTNLGRLLMLRKSFVAAESVLRESLAERQKSIPDAWNTFNTQSNLGGALLGQRKYADAEPLLHKGYEGLKQREKSIPPQGLARIPEALDRLIELYSATNKPDEVKKWRAERAKYPAANAAAQK